ncbi:MAG: flagellin [Bacteriovoracaceae bacterium]
MGMRINTNIPSIAGQRALGVASDEKLDALAKLSSGERITKAADDASGLAISEKLKAGIRSSMQATRNANDGISLVQVAEGGLSESSNLLVRMRELAIQAASDTYTQSDRDLTSKEFQQLKSEIDRISSSTEFNGKKLLDGSGPNLDFHVGTNSTSNDQIRFQSGEVASNSASLGISSVSVSSKFSAQDTLSKLDHAINKLSGNKATLGSIQNRLASSMSNMQINTNSLSASNSQIRDADYAIETSNNAMASIKESASTSVLSQANTNSASALKLLS